ncbi:MAG: DUF4097 family beta strand repeat protein [Candidatus Latescibacteria bacterium]|jgi:hypothetical protein|nr:DUF4097 family beta strand repeat protein [Candidatus Latescibacterota bacterium]
MKSKIVRYTAVCLMLLCVPYVKMSLAMSRDNSGSSRMERSLWGEFISEEINITLPGQPGISVMLDHSYGNINVNKGQNDKIVIKGEKRVSSRDSQLAREFLDAMELQIEERKGRIIIRTYYPQERLSERIRKKIKNFSISYTIEIPENTNLELKNSFGNVDLDNVSGEFSVTNSFGKVTAYDLEGRTELSNKFGSITAERFTGDTNVSNEHGALTVKQIKGNLVARTSFGSIEVREVEGDAKITNSHGKISAEKIGGEAELETTFGKLSCIDVKGKATLRNRHSGVTVRNVHNDVTVVTSFGKVEAEKIKGDLSVENQHSSVKVMNIAGEADVRTTFGRVNIDHVKGNVSVINQHSSIDVKNILPNSAERERRVLLKTTFGNIRLEAPESLSAQVKASTSNGKFSSDFPLMVTLQGTVLSSSSSDQRIAGTVGEGDDIIELENSHGNIYLGKSMDDDWEVTVDPIILNLFNE